MRCFAPLNMTGSSRHREPRSVILPLSQAKGKDLLPEQTLPSPDMSMTHPVLILVNWPPD